jgi:hypothetical protein
MEILTHEKVHKKCDPWSILSRLNKGNASISLYSLLKNLALCSLNRTFADDFEQELTPTIMKRTKKMVLVAMLTTVGRVVQHGSPDEVYRQGGVYKDIFDASARSMNVDKIASTINI